MSSESEAEAAFWAHAEKVQADYLSRGQGWQT